MGAVRGLELDFGTAWWAVSPTLDEATLVRVTPAPHLADVGACWGDVAGALLALLS